MLCNPERVIFEYKTDVIDYVTKGMVPTKKNFNQVMEKVRTPDVVKPDQGVYIPDGLFLNSDRYSFEDIMQRVYKNRVRNRNIGLGVAGIVVAGVLIGCMFGGSDPDPTPIENPKPEVVD